MVIKDALFMKYVVVHERKKEQIREQAAIEREVRRAAFKNAPLSKADEDKFFERMKKEREYECHVISVMPGEDRLGMQGPPRMSLSSFKFVHDVSRIRPLMPSRVLKIVRGVEEDESWAGEGMDAPSKSKLKDNQDVEDTDAGEKMNGAKQRPKSAQASHLSTAQKLPSTGGAKSGAVRPKSASSTLKGVEKFDLRPQSGTDPHAMVMHKLETGTGRRSKMAAIYDSENLPLSFLVPSGCASHVVVRCAVFRPPKRRAMLSRCPTKSKHDRGSSPEASGWGRPSSALLVRQQKFHADDRSRSAMSSRETDTRNRPWSAVSSSREIETRNRNRPWSAASSRETDIKNRPWSAASSRETDIKNRPWSAASSRVTDIKNRPWSAASSGRQFERRSIDSVSWEDRERERGAFKREVGGGRPWSALSIMSGNGQQQTRPGSALSRMSVATTADVQEVRITRPASACKCLTRRHSKGQPDLCAFGRSSSTATVSNHLYKTHVPWA